VADSTIAISEHARATNLNNLQPRVFSSIFRFNIQLGSSGSHTRMLIKGEGKFWLKSGKRRRAVNSQGSIALASKLQVRLSK